MAKPLESALIVVPYAFLDSDVAARRLALLARVFAPSTGDFVRRSITSTPELIVDLGCGPGYTTQLLADVFPRSRVAGLDASERFVALAQRRLESDSSAGTNRIAFYQHDVTRQPFPVGPADLLFCRFLITHLSEPGRALFGWAGQLRPGGLLVLEELCSG